MTGKGAAGVVQEARILHRGSADDDVGHPVVEAALDGIQVANATAEVDRYLLADFVENRLYRTFVLRLAGERAIEVDQMQPARPFAYPVPGHGCRVFGKYRGAFHRALLQADAVTILEINRGYQQHRKMGIRR